MGIYLLAIILVAAAGGCAWLAMRPVPVAGAKARKPSRATAASPAANTRAKGGDAKTPPTTTAYGTRPGWLRVLDADELLQSVHAHATLAQLKRQSRLSASVWDRDLLPAIRRYAEFVQLMPASESHHHAHAGGLLAHALETLLAAATWRNGCLLPQGAQAEAVDAQRDFWTYAVFFAALLHDVGKPMADLRIDWLRPGASDPVRWMPMAGTLIDCGAAEYRVAFAPKTERDYTAHGRLGVMLLQRLAPPSALSFLAREPEVLKALTQFLSGEDRDGPIADIVRRADQASTSRSLSQGSRARFGTAVSVPLIELLMSSLRDLLRRGGQLPLNRDGAIGWVFDGSVWFVAKRLADQVREHVQQHAPDEPIPGESKNDRLFDTWQEYGCITPNPLTQQAIWYVIVQGEDGGGYRHRLTMLRFPLDKLWDDASQYPAPMAGRIEILASRDAESAVEQPSLRQPSTNEPKAAAESPTVSAKAAPADRAPKAVPTSSGTVRAPTFKMARPPRARPNASPAVAVPSVATDGEPAADELLDDDDSARVEAQRANAAAAPAVLVQPVAVGQQTSPVALSTHLPALPGAQTSKPPSELATMFMQWLQAGLATRGITYNETGAPVHFVPAGMALVSPLIFREFARQHPAEEAADQAPERLGLDVQREVLKAGWHVPAPGGKNIHQFVVVKRGGVRAGRLSAVVLAEPHRWVVPVPPPNPAISAAEADTAAGAAA